MTRRDAPHPLVRAAVHVVVYAAALTMLLPFAWMVSTALKTRTEAIAEIPRLLPSGWPWEWRWHNFVEAWRVAELDRYYLNSIFVSVVLTVVAVAHNALAGFAFGKLRFAGKRVTFALLMGTMMLPYQVYFIFAYVLCNWLGFIDNLQSLIVVDTTEHSTLPLAVQALSAGLYVDSWPVQMAAATIITLPILVVFLLFQRQFVEGITLTGVKG